MSEVGNATAVPNGSVAHEMREPGERCKDRTHLSRLPRMRYALNSRLCPRTSLNGSFRINPACTPRKLVVHGISLRGNVTHRTVEADSLRGEKLQAWNDSILRGPSFKRKEAQ